jgi:hypothetical protein
MRLRVRPIRNLVVDQFELPFFTMVALDRGRAAFPNRLPKRPLSSLQQVAAARCKARKYLRLYFAEKRGERPFGGIKYRRRPPVSPGSVLSLAKLRPKEKQRDPRLGAEFRALFATEFLHRLTH